MRQILFGLLIICGSLTYADEQQDYDHGVEKWESLKTQQNRPCDPQVDSTEVLQGHKTPIAVLILHGYTQNPQAMSEYVEFFKNYDVNILVPRLAHHFDVDIRSLDKVSAQEWINQTQSAFEAAQNLGSHVVVVGYSLGGLLASRLALNPKNTKSLAGLILLSPALRLTGNVEIGAAVASLMQKTGNELLKMAPPACGSSTPYLSVNGGKQVVSLMKSTDPAYPHPDGTIYKRIFAAELASSKPVFLSVVEGDEVVDSVSLQEMATPIPQNGYLTFLKFANHDKSQSPHSTLTLPGVGNRNWIPNASQTPYRANQIFDQMSAFLRDWVGLETPAT